MGIIFAERGKKIGTGGRMGAMSAMGAASKAKPPAGGTMKPANAYGAPPARSSYKPMPKPMMPNWSAPKPPAAKGGAMMGAMPSKPSSGAKSMLKMPMPTMSGGMKPPATTTRVAATNMGPRGFTDAQKAQINKRLKAKIIKST